MTMTVLHEHINFQVVGRTNIFLPRPKPGFWDQSIFPPLSLWNSWKSWNILQLCSYTIRIRNWRLNRKERRILLIVTIHCKSSLAFKCKIMCQYSTFSLSWSTHMRARSCPPLAIPIMFQWFIFVCTIHT